MLSVVIYAVYFQFKKTDVNGACLCLMLMLLVSNTWITHTSTTISSYTMVTICPGVSGARSGGVRPGPGVSGQVWGCQARSRGVRPGPGVSGQFQGCVPKWGVPAQELGHYRDTGAGVALCPTRYGRQEGCTLFWLSCVSLGFRFRFT